MITIEMTFEFELEEQQPDLCAICGKPNGNIRESGVLLDEEDNKTIIAVLHRNCYWELKKEIDERSNTLY